MWPSLHISHHLRVLLQLRHWIGGHRGGHVGRAVRGSHRWRGRSRVSGSGQREGECPPDPTRRSARVQAQMGAPVAHIRCTGVGMRVFVCVSVYMAISTILLCIWKNHKKTAKDMRAARALPSTNHTLHLHTAHLHHTPLAVTDVRSGIHDQFFTKIELAR